MSTTSGHCSTGYEPVKEAFEQLARSGCEDKLQLCVYVGKECVLDLISHKQGDNYTSDSIQVLKANIPWQE